MRRIHRLVVLAVVAAVVGALSGTSTARDLVYGWERGYYNSYVGEDPIPGQETWATYYSKHAQVRDGSQKQLANGVRWRLVTDQRTKIAMPRIVWMPDNKKRDIANRVLEMVHGGAMLFSKQQQEGFREYLRLYGEEDSQGPSQSKEKHKQYLQAVLKMVPKRVVIQSDVALTYASTRFVSLIDLGFIYTLEGTYTPRIIRGLTLDLEQRRLFTMEACPEGSFRRPGAIFNPAFRFADLLEICDQVSLERFEAAVQAAEDRTKAATASSNDPLVEGCRGTSIDHEQEFVVYLGVDGLAVHLTQFWIKNGTLWSDSNTPSCTLKLSARNPLIVPYRDLEPLMKPGPLREELLKSK